jgi:hypothetical protein
VNRLPAAGQVNDAQPPHAEPYRAARINALIVRTTVNDGLAHSPHFGGIDNIAGPTDHTSYSAHGFTSNASGSEME